MKAAGNLRAAWPTQTSLVKLFVIHFFADPPQVTLHLGSTLNPDDIKEGDDVYFECNIKANPKQHKITWFHDVSILILGFLVLRFDLLINN